LRTARPVNKNYRLLNILRNADVNKVVLLSYGRPSSAVAELLLNDLSYISRFQPQTQSLGLVAIAELLVLLKWVS